MIMINVGWYIEQTVSGIEKTVEDCTKHGKKHYTFANGNIKEGENYIIDEDWENGWSKV